MREDEYHSDSSRHPSSRALRRLAIAASVIFGLLVVAALFLVFRWPFREKDVIQALEQRLHRSVTAKEFHGTYFPHPGCVMNGLIVSRERLDPTAPPFATATKLTIAASYLDLFVRPHYIRMIVVDDLLVQILPRNTQSAPTSDSNTQNQDPEGSEIRVGSIVAQNARLIIGRANGKNPLDFAIHSLVLGSVARDQQLSYGVEMTNPLPPGELSAHGKFGPWNTRNYKQTPLSGSSVLQRANLDVFPSISGSLSSQNQFSGVLESIAITGWTDVPDFHVKSASHTVHLNAPFRAIVNGTNGDVRLQDVKAKVDKTIIAAKGSIAGHTGQKGKVTSLDFSARSGRIEDVLNLFVKSPQPPLEGTTSFEAHAVIQAFGGSFLKKTLLGGAFEIRDAKFSQSHTQQNVNSLSARSQGEKQDPGTAPLALADFRGRLNMKDGKAQFSDLSMSVLGALAQMNGVYDLLDERIDFHGTLRTNTEISKTTSGIKSVLLKPLDPLFKKKNAGAVIPVEMTGVYENPHFGIDLAAQKKKHSSSPQ